MKGLHQIAKIKGLDNLSLWQRLKYKSLTL